MCSFSFSASTINTEKSTSKWVPANKRRAKASKNLKLLLSIYIYYYRTDPEIKLFLEEKKKDKKENERRLDQPDKHASRFCSVRHSVVSTDSLDNRPSTSRRCGNCSAIDATTSCTAPSRVSAVRSPCSTCPTSGGRKRGCEGSAKLVSVHR